MAEPSSNPPQASDSSSTSQEPRRPGDEYFDNAAIERALKLATRDALLEHARMGRSVCESRDGKIVWIPPAEVFARYGLDQFGRPKQTPEAANAAVFPALACIWEATARKVGNVHPGAAFADTEYTQFLTSALALNEAFSLCGKASVGSLILNAAQQTRAIAGRNTNLGMILLLAPLATANRDGDLRQAAEHVLQNLTQADARDTFEAIRLANPGGLGDAAEQDVHSEPTVTLLEAMKLAADRDMVARQYANGFADVFDFGVPAFLSGFEKFGCVEAAITDSQLRWLAEYPDSLIARKNGSAVAADVQKRAAEVLAHGGIASPEGRAAGVALDRHLRGNGNKLNPGTTADLITACLFVALRERQISPSAPFRWHAPDWL